MQYPFRLTVFEASGSERQYCWPQSHKIFPDKANTCCKFKRTADQPPKKKSQHHWVNKFKEQLISKNHPIPTCCLECVWRCFSEGCNRIEKIGQLVPPSTPLLLHLPGDQLDLTANHLHSYLKCFPNGFDRF